MFTELWQSWGENRRVEIRKPGWAGLGGFKTCVWDLKGVEDLRCSSPFLQGCIGLCWMYFLTLRVTIFGANTLVSWQVLMQINQPV